MCLAIPGQITEFCPGEAAFATIDVLGVRRKVNIDLVRHEPLAVGDWVLVHVGFAMSLIDAAEARRQLDFLRELGEAQAAYEELLDAETA